MSGPDVSAGQLAGAAGPGPSLGGMCQTRGGYQTLVYPAPACSASFTGLSQVEFSALRKLDMVS